MVPPLGPKLVAVGFVQVAQPTDLLMIEIVVELLLPNSHQKILHPHWVVLAPHWWHHHQLACASGQVAGCWHAGPPSQRSVADRSDPSK